MKSPDPDHLQRANDMQDALAHLQLVLGPGIAIVIISSPTEDAEHTIVVHNSSMENVGTALFDLGRQFLKEVS